MGVFAVGVDMVLNNSPVRLALKTNSFDGEASYGTGLALSGLSAELHPFPWSMRFFSLGLLYPLSLGSFPWCGLVACLDVCRVENLGLAGGLGG